jgi:4-hydroxyphenylpyruvate dioxygenase
MRPFPHDAPKSTFSDANPAGPEGFEFVEFAHPNPDGLSELFGKMGYAYTETHETKDIQLWLQGDITYDLNNELGSQALRFVEERGPCSPSMAWRVVDAQQAFDHAVSKGAKLYEETDKAIEVPAIEGIYRSVRR